jgi:hypothetical protein
VARRSFSAVLALSAGLFALPSIINISPVQAQSANDSFIVDRVKTKDPVVFITIDDGSVITDGLVNLLL